MTAREVLASELAAPLATDDGWADGYVIVRRETLAAYLQLTEPELTR